MLTKHLTVPYMGEIGQYRYQNIVFTEVLRLPDMKTRNKTVLVSRFFFSCKFFETHKFVILLINDTTNANKCALH